MSLTVSHTSVNRLIDVWGRDLTTHKHKRWKTALDAKTQDAEDSFGINGNFPGFMRDALKLSCYSYTRVFDQKH